MKNLLILLCLLLFGTAHSQKFAVGYSVGNIDLENKILFPGNVNAELNYSVITPMKLYGKVFVHRGIFLRGDFSLRRESLDRFYSGVPTGEYNWTILDLGLHAGHEWRSGNWSLAADLGSHYSKVGYWNSRNNSLGQEKFHNYSILSSDLMIDMEVGVGIGVYITRKFKVFSRGMFRKRIYTTQHGDKLLRIINYHPTHIQQYLYGLEVGVEYKF